MKTFIVLILIYICRTIDTYTFIDKANSYIRYNQWNASINGTLKFRFKTYKSVGLILYSDNSKSSFSNSIRNSLAVTLLSGKLSVTVQMGHKDQYSRKSIKIGEKLDNLEWHDVTITRKGPETLITLDTKEMVIINDGYRSTLELSSGLYVGWVSDEMEQSEMLVDKSILVNPRFTGCIDQLEYSHSTSPSIFTSKELEKVQVSPGCLNACENQTCPNEGRCINQFTKIKCDCIGTGYYGVLCKKEAQSIEFKGWQYMTIDVVKRLKTTPTNEIKFRFKTTDGNGVIFATMNGNDHLMVELYSNIIRLSVDLGGGYHISEINNMPFNDGKWHLVEIFRKGRHTTIQVDKKYCINSGTPGQNSHLDIRTSLLHIGGHPNVDILRKMNSQSKKNFTGCLQQFYYNGMNVIYKVLNVRSPRFKKHGKIKEGCNVFPGKVISARDNMAPSISKSRKRGHHDLTIDNDTISTTPPLGHRPEIQQGRKIANDPNTLSRNSVVWITVGLVIGSIVLLITVGVIVHNVRHRYRAVLLSSSLKSLKDNNNSLHRKFSSNDRILRGSTDRMLLGSSDRLIRASTDRLIRGSTDRIMRGSTDRIMRGSTDRIMRGSTDRIMRGSTDRLIRGNERMMRASTDRIMRASTDRISRPGDRSHRGSVHGSIPAINERYIRDKKERSCKPNGEILMTNYNTRNGDISMNNYSGRILNDIKDSPVLSPREDSSSTVATHVA